MRGHRWIRMGEVRLMDQPSTYPHVHTEAEIAAYRHRLAFANTLKIGLFALAVGTFGAFLFDWHCHTCVCGNRWSHLGAFNVGDESKHACPRCGSQQWRKDGF